MTLEPLLLLTSFHKFQMPLEPLLSLTWLTFALLFPHHISSHSVCSKQPVLTTLAVTAQRLQGLEVVKNYIFSVFSEKAE